MLACIEVRAGAHCCGVTCWRSAWQLLVVGAWRPAQLLQLRMDMAACWPLLLGCSPAAPGCVARIGSLLRLLPWCPVGTG
jgi:hypothetical protein